MGYLTILVDPPWPKKRTGSLLRDRSFKSVPDVYPTMTIEQIAQMPIGDLAEKGTHLWLWSTNGMLPHAFEVLKRWGFKYHAPIVWVKSSGNGNYFIHRTEFLIFGYWEKCYFTRARYKPTVYH